MTKFQSHFLIKIGGADVSKEFQDALEEVIVDTTLYMPSMFSIRVHDPQLKWVDDTSLDIGKEVEISVQVDEQFEGEVTSSTPVVVIKGEITSLEPCFSAYGETAMQIRGYDKSHRLHRDRKTRTFLSKTDSDLASTIAGEAGLSAQVDATTVTYDFVIQYNQTNMEFLKSRAERIGYQVWVADGKLNFKKGDYIPPLDATLTFMEDLLSFEPRFTTNHQANTMTVKSWDPKGKTAITSTKTPVASLNQGGMTQTGGAKAAASFSSAAEVSMDQPVFTVAEADAIANGLSHDISRDFVQADGICEGHPKVKAGGKIKIEKVGTRFSGEYLVTTAMHVYTVEGYRTHFSISGRHPNTLSYLVNGGDGHPAVDAMPGPVTALVTNLNDPDDLGRVKVKYAWMGEIESHWARLASPMAGALRGLMILPEVNDEVLVVFEHGDIHRPYIIGALWSNTDKPPKKNSEAVVGGKVNQRVLKTRKGHLIILDDKDKAEQISIQTKGGHKFILDDTAGSEKITLADKTGNNSMVITSSTNSMAINVNGDFSVTAKGKITLKSTMDMSLESTANAKMKGIQLGLEGTARGELKAPTVSINGSAQAELKGGAMTMIQGGIVKIN